MFIKRDLLYLFKRYLSIKKQAVKLKFKKERELEIKEKLHKTEKLEIELKNKENELAYMALSSAQKKKWGLKNEIISKSHLRSL